MLQKKLVDALLKMPEDGMGYSKVVVTTENGEVFHAVAVGCHMVMIPASDIVKVEHDNG